jgi:hypothetical protein
LDAGARREEVRRVARGYGLIAIVSALSVVRGCALLIEDRACHCHVPPRLEIARARVDEIAFEAYPRWRMTHAGCPSLDELDVDDPVDPWGNRYEIFCTEHGLTARSLGEDARPSADDIWSEP